ncbi:MAG TPA: hypothetical protein VF704_02850 [Allosphingosinicella sp.]
MNVPPTLDLNGPDAGTNSEIAFAENDPATAIAPAATFNGDSTDFAGATLTVAFTAGASTDDQLVLIGSPGGAVNDEGNLSIYDPAEETWVLAAAYSGGSDPETPLVVTFTARATLEFVEAVLRAVAFANGSETLAAGERTVGFTLTDGEGASSTQQFGVVEVTADSDPPVAADDSIAADEDKILLGSVLDDNGNGGDYDPEGGPPPQVLEVNDDHALVGLPILLASGAVLQINADGTFSYDPNGRFGYLISPDKALATGAVFETPVETVTYTITGGATATLTITVGGVDSIDDELRGTDDHDVIVGTAGPDLFILSQGGDERATGAGGNDRFDFGGTFDNGDRVDGGAGDDELRLSGGLKLLLGAQTLLDVERIVLGPGGSYALTTDAATVADGATLQVDGAELHSGDGLNFDGSAQTLGAFIVTGGAGDDDIVTGGGDDILAGGGGSNRLDGGDGTDVAAYSASAGPVTADLSAQAASDNGAGGADILLNLEGLIGSAQADSLTGDDGDNLLDGGGGADVMIGGLGNDSYRVDDAGDSITENDEGGTERVFSSISYRLGENLENLTLTGSEAIGGTGNSGANEIVGNDAANRLDGDGGSDLMIGGGGDDIYIVEHAGDRAREQRDGGTDTVRASVDFTLGAHVEKLVLIAGAVAGTGNNADNAIKGSRIANILKGGGGSDTILGMAGKDVIYGDAGKDHLDGGASSDIIYGGVSSDTIIGGAGDDWLYGQTGNDTLLGGIGRDVFFFDTAPNRSTNVDRLPDFSPVDDTIALDRNAFAGIAASGRLAADSFHIGAMAGDSSDRIVYDSATGQLFYDADGVGGADQVLIARMATGLALTNADFVGYI